MKNKNIYMIAGIIIISIFIIGAVDSVYFKINKSFEIFGELFREINYNYVDEIDPEELVKAGIEGMLENLDPYTIFLDEDGNEDMDIITNGTYAGLGITVSVQDNKLTVMDVQDGFSASRSGIRVGDRLYKIDSMVVINSQSDELRKYTRGPSGVDVNVWILRDGRKDTLHYIIKREEIKLKNVSYSGLIKDSIGYIKLDRFSRSSTQEVTEALNNLRRTGKLKGLILDLRDNPGGLLEAAVSICELFVPKNSIIVTTKGRDARNTREYRSILNPLDSNLPLSVIINGSSASASEIVAGALQDLDRGIIVGKKSYGKGLVQSVYDLPYNTAVKITTSKYYIPSGRCIQKINYSKNKTKLNEKTDFFTKNGRHVDESIGIIPDTTVIEKDTPFFVEDLINNSLLFKFANIYTSNLDKLPDDFIIDKQIKDKFIKFLEDERYYYQTPVNSKLEDLINYVDKEQLNKGVKEKLELIKKDLKTEEKELVKRQDIEIFKYLKYEILRRFKTQKQMMEYGINEDEYINTALGLLTTPMYKSILSIKSNDKEHKN